MPDQSARLGLPYLLPSQAQKHVTHNAALGLLDILVQLVVESFDATDPPATPQDGQVHAVGTGATGAWAGQDGMLAAWSDGGWLFIAPQDGWQAVARSTGAQHRYDAGIWALPDFNALNGVGIGASADAVNRLALASEASLFSHAGAGHQIKINKAATTDTASLLYQSGYSGRAEMGLAGDDDWSIKVSADGVAWTNALTIDAATGRSDFAAPLRLASYPVASLPAASAAGAGAMIFVPDATGGAVTAFSDGTNWRRTTDRAVVS